MQLVDIPAKFSIPFANNAGASYIRSVPKDHVTATTEDAPASLHDGFPPETFTPQESGGVPPSGADFNGILKQITAWCRWQAAGIPAQYDNDFSAAIGGYPKLTVLASTTPGRLWQSKVDNNTTDPDSSSAANWIALTTAPSGSANVLIHADGKIEQWGYVAHSSSTETAIPVALPMPYANAAYGLQLTPAVTSFTNFADMWVQSIHSSKTATGFQAQYQKPGGDDNPRLDGFEWRTIGVGA